MKLVRWHHLAPVLGMFFLISCGPRPGPQAMAGNPQVTHAPPYTVPQFQAFHYAGPKKRITVMRFVDKSGASRSRADIGSGMAEQLVTSLVRTGRFIVIERQMLEDILREQDFAASGRVRPETSIRIGELEAPEFLVYGVITEFSEDKSGAEASGQFGRSIGSAVGSYAPYGGGAAGALIGGLIAGSGRVRKAHVAVDIRIVDARTGRIVNATSVSGSPTDVGGSFGAAPGNVAFGVSGFYKTPLGKAVRACIDKSVAWIVASAFPPGGQYQYQR